MRQELDDKLQYVHLKNDKTHVYRICDDKVVDGVKKLVLLTVDPQGYGRYVEAYPDEVQPVDRDPYTILGSVSPAD